MEKVVYMRTFLFFILAGLCFCSFTPLPEAGPIRTLIIDAGHGGKDPGAIGSQFREKDITLKVALKLRDLMREQMPEVKVVLTRETDVFIELHRRGEIAIENEGDFFISIHCNAMKLKDRRGAETYVLGVNNGQEGYETVIAENEAILFEKNYLDEYGGFDPRSPEAYIFFKLMKNVFRNESSRLAGKIQEQYTSTIPRVDRGVKQAPFVVLYMSGMPSVLTEIGFVSNPEDEQFIGSETGQTYIAASIVRALQAYNQE